MYFNPYAPQPAYPYYTYTPDREVSGPTPIYALLVVGMVFFMASNVMPNLVPAADRVWHTAPFVLQWGFLIIICALLVQMTGLLPGVPQIHITYVHMTIAMLLFVIMWNQIVPEPSPPPPEEKKSSSSSSKEKPKEEKKEEKKKAEPEKEEPSPWDDLRAHPSAFLTTRVNKMMPWPFPMGKASSGGKELWWEKGMPAHVGHFNRPEPPAPKTDSDEEAEKKKKEAEEKQKAMEKEKEKEKAKAKQKEAEQAKEKQAAVEKEKAAKEAAAKAKAKEDEAKRAKEMEKAKAEQARRQAVEDKQRQKLWRTKYLVMIVGISFLNRSLAFLLLLFLCLQMVHQELNKAVPPSSAPSAATPAPAPVPASSSSSSSQGSSSTGSSSKPALSSSANAEKEQMAKMKAMKEKEAAEKAKSSSSSSSAKPSSSSSSAKPSSSSPRSSSSKPSSSSSSSSSKPKDAPVSSDAVRKAAGSTTVTKVDPGEDSSIGVPYTVGFGMNYIFNPDGKGEALESPSMPIPSTGMSHPLMTTTYRQYAN